ncbi:MAG: hypothetical protein LBO74_14805 [Candidatus Symbiothrix sp.]|jgi:hypothetical protein|nr:hypothetical protein [Candidatus Symbiothrix sp.]
MKTDNDIQDKLLNDLFGEMVLETPSEGFTQKLLFRIEKEAAREKRKARWMITGQIAAGICSIVLLPGLALYLCSLLFPGFSYSFTWPPMKVEFDPVIFIIGFPVLLLLILDTLFRKQAHSGK